jgi:hypothetical protein
MLFLGLGLQARNFSEDQGLGAKMRERRRDRDTWRLATGRSQQHGGPRNRGCRGSRGIQDGPKAIPRGRAPGRLSARHMARVRWGMACRAWH